VLKMTILCFLPIFTILIDTLIRFFYLWAKFLEGLSWNFVVGGEQEEGDDRKERQGVNYSKLKGRGNRKLGFWPILGYMGMAY
jgi:hypothetical protein